jgi:hypothetical protein
VSVPMGVMEDIGMPVNLTFAGKAYDDCNLLSFAYVYEQASRKRSPPRLTPSIDSDVISLKVNIESRRVQRRLPRGATDSLGRAHKQDSTPRPKPKLKIVRCDNTTVDQKFDELQVEISGTLSITPGAAGSHPESDALEYLHI